MNLSSTHLLGVCGRPVFGVKMPKFKDEGGWSSHRTPRSYQNSQSLHAERVTVCSDVLQTGSLFLICVGPSKLITLFYGTYGYGWGQEHTLVRMEALDGNMGCRATYFWGFSMEAITVALYQAWTVLQVYELSAGFHVTAPVWTARLSEEASYLITVGCLGQAHSMLTSHSLYITYVKDYISISITHNSLVRGFLSPCVQRT